MDTGIRGFVIIIGFLVCTGVCITATTAQDNSLKNLTYLTEEFPPFNYEENGTPAGLAIDLLAAVTREAGDGIPAGDIRIVPLNEGLSTVRNTTGAVIFSIARTPGRENDYRWIGPFATYSIVLFSLRDRNITSLSAGELRDYTIGAVTSDVSVEKLAELGVSPEHIVTNPDPAELFRMLDEGTIDLVASGDIAGEYFMKKTDRNPESYRIVYRIESTPLYYAFNKETPGELIGRFKQAYERVKSEKDQDGTTAYDRVLKKYLSS